MSALGSSVVLVHSPDGCNAAYGQGPGVRACVRGLACRGQLRRVQPHLDDNAWRCLATGGARPPYNHVANLVLLP